MESLNLIYCSIKIVLQYCVPVDIHKIHCKEKRTEFHPFLPRDSVSLRRAGPYQYPAIDTKYEDTKYNDSQYLVDDSKYALDTEDSKSFDHLMPSSGYIF